MNAELPLKAIELLVSRICHDLVSPVGAVNNGIEFMRDMGADGLEDSIGLIEHSARQASVRLQLFRLCYGAGGSESMITGKMVYEAFQNYIDPAKYEMNWDLLNDVPDDYPRGFLKVLVNIMVFVQEALPKGGEINLSYDNGVMRVSGSGKMIRLREGMKEALLGELPLDLLDPKLVHAYMCSFFAKGFGYTLKHSQDEDSIAIEMAS